MKGRMTGVPGVAVALAVTALLLGPGSAEAADFVVNSLNDPALANGCTTAADGCTLRDAITDAEGNGQPDDITFSVTGSIQLGNSLPMITKATTITGPGPDASALAIRGNTMTSTILPVFADGGVTVRIERLEIADARATSFSGGGISKSGNGSLVLDSVILFDNDGGEGGAVHNGGGNVSIRNSLLHNNRSEDFGGAIMSTAATTEVINSTLTANSAKQFGGAIAAVTGSGVSVLSSTITGNTANSDDNLTGDGGGIYNAAVVRVGNTILAGNMVGASGGPNGQCSGDFLTSEYNLRSAADAACNGFTGGGNLVDPDPGLGTLSSNGGPTQTIPLLASSPAIDAGNPDPLAADPCPTTDQRGLPRFGGAGRCDIGAFEVQPPPALTAPHPQPSNTFTLGKLKRNKRKGIAFLFVNLPGPGEVGLRGKGLRTIGGAGVARASLAVAGGTVKLKVAPAKKGRRARGIRRALLRKGKAKVKALVTYLPSGGAANTQGRKVKLVRK